MVNNKRMETPHAESRWSGVYWLDRALAAGLSHRRGHAVRRDRDGHEEVAMSHRLAELERACACKPITLNVGAYEACLASGKTHAIPCDNNEHEA